MGAAGMAGQEHGLKASARQKWVKNLKKIRGISSRGEG